MRDNCGNDELTWRDDPTVAGISSHFSNNARAYKVGACITATGGLIGYFCGAPTKGAAIGAAISTGLIALSHYLP